METIGAPRSEAEASHAGHNFRRVTDLLGGVEVLDEAPSTELDVHDLLLRGLPSRALSSLLDSLIVLGKNQSLEQAVGISLRTYQRRSEQPDRPLSQEQSGRTWKFAEILALATNVFGSQEEAERWMERPAMALDQRRPIDLLATPAGIGLVETLLKRIDYGVYT
jgi:putative toxin-antitoxin system antitoxin component (TIGR02293 family)